MVHQLKLEGPELAGAVLSGDKSYEIRVNDRGYEVGDLLYQVLHCVDAGIYFKHDVSKYMYMVGYISNIQCNGEEYVVMGIQRACESEPVIRALLRKFADKGEPCTVIRLGQRMDDCIITSVTEHCAHLSWEKCTMVERIEHIVWVTPNMQVTPENRSITYDSLNLKDVLTADDFETVKQYRRFISTD